MDEWNFRFTYVEVARMIISMMKSMMKVSLFK